MAQPLTELKEPLISMETKKNLEENFLKSYRNLFRSHHSQQQEVYEEQNNQQYDNQQQSEQQNEEQQKQEPEPNNQGYKHQLINFKDEVNSLTRQPFDYQSHLKEFFLKATAYHELPNLEIKNICQQKSNPNIFATISKSSDLFSKIDVHEFMGMEDYRRLSRIRIRNYVNILRMVTRVDTTKENYDEVKMKLYQIKKLTSYLSMDFDKIYQRLEKDKQIYDLEDGDDEQQPEKPQEEEQKSQHDEGEEKKDQEDQEKSQKDENDGEDQENKSQKEDGDGENEEKDEEEDDDEYGEESEEASEENEEDKEYENFYKMSDLGNNWNRQYYTLELLKEEEKWVKRAEWLENMLEKLKKNDETKGWAPWFQAKLDHLADLDVPIKNVTESQNSQIFYFFKFLDEQMTKFNPENEYHKDQKVYPEEQYSYPKMKYDINYSLNEAAATLKSWSTIREKLCRRVKQREMDTEYFITVFEKKPFGNEKIYEKRLNFREKSVSPDKFEMHPNGGYLYLDISVNSSNFQMIFNLNAQFKDPLLLKRSSQSNSTYLGFQDKYFYNRISLRKEVEKKKEEEAPTKDGQDADDMHMVIEEETKKGDDGATPDQEQQQQQQQQDDQDKPKDQEQEQEQQDQEQQQQEEEEEQHEEQQEEEKEYDCFDRIYEYDLVDFNKVKYVDIRDTEHFTKDDSEVITQKYKDGYVFLYKKYDQERKFFNFEISYKNDILKMDSSEKFDANTSEVTYKLNDKLDRLFISSWKDGIFTIQKFAIDFKEKKIKKAEDVKLKQDYFELEKGKFDIHVEPMYSDFLMLFKTKQSKKVYVFQSELYITQFEGDIDSYYMYRYKFNYSQEKGLISIILQDPDLYSFYYKNQFRYQIIEQQGEKKEWAISQITHDIYNRVEEVCFPYAYVIYNHDQVYMKDLTQQNHKGYYYMNNFMGIDAGHRPLTIHSAVYSNKLNLSIPVINSNYTASDFLLKVHQIKSHYEQNTMFKFKGYLRFRVYTYNQDILSILSQWSGLTDSKNRLHSEIKIQSKYNSMNVEQWEKGKCLQRLVVTIFHIPKEFDERDVTNTDATLEYKPQGCWFILSQKMQGQSSSIEVFTREMRYSFKFPELLTLKSIWDYSDDDSANDIYGIFVDTLVKNKIDLYIMYSNCQMRKFSSPINSIYLQFEEHPHIYNLQYAFKGILNESGDAGSKRINLYEQFRGDIFIANSIMYSQQGAVDLSVLNMQDKFQLGNQLSQYKHHLRELTNIQKLTYSHNEARLAAFYKCQDLYQYTNGTMLIITPLYNTRQIPQFPHRAFKHPVVPIVDKNAGCTSVFSLFLGTDYYNWGTYWYTHAYSRKRMWNKLVNLNPGFLIKHFNGVEEQVPLHLYGEQFSEIIRFQQSLDGKYILIVGTRKGKLEDRFYDQNMLMQQGDLQNGMFLYKISNIVDITLVKAFLFAVKNPYTYQEEVVKKLQMPATQILELVPPEIAGPQVGEYSNSNIDSDGRQDYVEYNDYIDFKQTDEQYVDELKLKREQEKIKKQQELEAQMRKNSKSTNNRSTNNRLTNRASLIQSLGADGEEHAHPAENQNNENQEGEQEQKTPEEEEFANIARLDDLNILFPGFDIPYLAKLPDWQKQFEEIQYEAVTSRKYDAPSDPNIPEGEERFTYEYEKRTAKVFSDEQAEKIQKIHANMHLEVNDNGHIFLINRLNNKLYFFYECNGEHKVAALKFEPEFVIKTADSSDKYLIVTAIESIEGQTTKHRYRVLNIENMLRCENHNARYTLRELFVVFDSKTFESNGTIKEAIGNDEYSYTIDDCKIMQDTVILKITDNSGVHYLKAFNIKKQILTYYIEGKRFLLSGDKRYVWIMETNEVYDIIDGLSTFFMWPGDQINTHSYDHMDAFNVNEDRTIMSTQGYLQLAFNYLSMQVDDELNSMTFKQSDAFFNKGNNLQYLYYKISDFKSILERIFMDDFDKMSSKKFHYNDDEPESNENQEVKDDKKITEEQTNKEVSQNKQISNLLTYLSEVYDCEKQNPAHISNFFLSFYSIAKKNYQLGDGEKEYYYMNIFEKLFSLKYDKRGDLIEDILNYVVHCNTIPITQNVINSCFTHFLQNANSSQSFQYYLGNITLKTTKMQEIEKFQIATTEQGFIVQSYNSPIMDDMFHTKFRQIKETKKDVEISYINLGNLLIEHGQDIMEMLSDKKYLSIMDIPFIRYLVMYQWFNIKNTIHKKLLVPFIALLILFTVYVTNIDFKDIQDVVEISGWVVFYQIFTWINFFLLSGVLIYFFYIESKQFMKDPTDYFGDFWNITDLLSYFLCLIVIILDRANVDASINRPIASLCLIILWIKMFYFLRVFESTSKLIRMIIEIVNDMKNFLIVMIIGIVGFSGGFYILQQAVNTDLPMESYPMSIIYTYRLAQGDFDLDFIDNLVGVDYILGWLLFIMGSLFLVIVLLNLLIAIMGDTFSRVLESITNLTVREKVMLISENEALFERNLLFQSAQFLVVINEKNLDSVQSENWDGQINALRRQVLDKVTALETNLDVKITENQKDLKKRIMDQEEKQRKAVGMQEQRIQSTVKSEFVEAFTKIHEQFNLQQTSMKSQQTIAHEQVRTMRMLQDQIEQLRSEQSRLSQFVQKAVGKNSDNYSDHEE